MTEGVPEQSHEQLGGEESLFMDHPTKGRVTTAEYQQLCAERAAELVASGADPVRAQYDATARVYEELVGEDPRLFQWVNILNDFLPDVTLPPGS